MLEEGPILLYTQGIQEIGKDEEGNKEDLYSYLDCPRIYYRSYGWINGIRRRTGSCSKFS